MSGNGVDLGSIYGLLGIVAGDVRELKQNVNDLLVRVDKVERKVDDLDGKVTGLQRAVTDYHSAVLGHGILISKLDMRLRRVEQHLNMPAA